MYVIERFPPHLNYATILPCESENSKQLLK